MTKFTLEQYLKNGFAEDDILLYVPSENEIIYMQLGDGSQLDAEDIAKGFTGYIDYTVSAFDADGDNYFSEKDGGLFLYQETEEDEEEFLHHIFDALTFIYSDDIVNDSDFDVILLRSGLTA